MSATALSRELRDSGDPYLKHRRAVVAASTVASGCMQLVGLYQMGIVRHLPEPPLPFFNSDRVDAAPEAYERMSLSMPDAILGLRSYATTAALAAWGGARRHETMPLVPLAMAAKAGIDAAQAAKLTWEQWSKHRAFCFWCLTAAAATFAAVPFVLPEAKAALRKLTSG